MARGYRNVSMEAFEHKSDDPLSDDEFGQLVSITGGITLNLQKFVSFLQQNKTLSV